MAAKDQLLLLVKQRLDMMSGITARDEYITARIAAAKRELENMGLTLDDGIDDTMLIVDYAVWSYGNRDKPGGVPDWLRARIRGKWLREGRRSE